MSKMNINYFVCVQFISWKKKKKKLKRSQHHISIYFLYKWFDIYVNKGLPWTWFFRTPTFTNGNIFCFILLVFACFIFIWAILTYIRRWYAFLFTDNNDMLSDQRMVWFFSASTADLFIKAYYRIFCQNAYRIWLKKKYLSNWFLVWYRDWLFTIRYQSLGVFTKEYWFIYSSKNQYHKIETLPHLVKLDCFCRPCRPDISQPHMYDFFRQNTLCRPLMWSMLFIEVNSWWRKNRGLNTEHVGQDLLLHFSLPFPLL